MTRKSEKASRAKGLRANKAFNEFVDEVLEDQSKVFLNAASTPEQLEQAHGMVRAIEAIKARMKAAETDARFEQKRSAP